MQERALQDISAKAKLEIAQKSNELYNAEKAKNLKKLNEKYKHKTAKIMEKSMLKSQKRCRKIFKNADNIQQCKDNIVNLWNFDKDSMK